MSNPVPTAPSVAIDPRPRAKHVMIGTTQSLCPQCMEVVPAKIITIGKRVYFRKRCPEHGERDDFVCSDASWWDRGEGHTPSVLPLSRSTAHARGCPHDCGLCPDHEQHTCIGLVELTDRCNLSCPMCFASSGPHGRDLPMSDIIAALDRLVATEGRAEVCQLSGGEPTLHADFETIVDEALARPIDYVMVNTNGIRLAKDPGLVSFLAERKDRVEIYLQWDGEDDTTLTRLRGEPLSDIKRRALDALERADLNVTLVATLHPPLGDGFYESLWRQARTRANITGISLQPATYSGRHLTCSDLETRITFPDVIRDLSRSSGGAVNEQDFSPLPCAHPNCHQILLAARDGEAIVPLSRAASLRDNLDLIAGGISFTPERSRQLMEIFLSRMSHCGSDCGCGDVVSIGGPAAVPASEIDPVLERFFSRVLLGQATAKNLLRITITSFLDAYNFDVRQVMKCCTHHVLPSGHVVPFCAYNTLYRPGHLSLPPLGIRSSSPN
ncbi:MAG: radical SAM protein [Planctomycetaceae bacterium]